MFVDDVAKKINSKKVNFSKYFSDFFYTHVLTEEKYREMKGRTQRNMGIQLVEQLYAKTESQKRNHAETNPFRNAVVYFGDDDNSYDSKFLDLLKGTKRLSLFNVGLITNALLEGPLTENNKVSF